MKTRGKLPIPLESVRVRSQMPPCIHRRYVRENPIDGSLFYAELLIMLPHAWERAPESADPSWDVIALRFLVIAHRNLF